MKALLTGIVAGVASCWLPLAAIDPIARLIVPAIALLATSIFPCMSLAVGALKAEQRAPAQVDELYGQLRTIMQVLVASFALAVCAVGGIAALTSIVDTAPKALLEAPAAVVSVHAFLFAICLILALLGGRVIAVGKSFFAILDINRKHALLVARSRVQSDRDKAIEAARSEKFQTDNKVENLRRA